MSAAKKQDTSGSFAWLLGPGRPVLIAALLIAVFAGGSYLAWLKLRTRILSAPEYLVGPENVEITPLPRWIHRKDGEFQAEVFRDPALAGPLSIMADDLTARISKAFAEQPWVLRVVRVTKRHPASVSVELEYRQPVCMVEVPGSVNGDYYAVDAYGVILPSEDFTSVEAARYPHLTGVDRRPARMEAGARWSDPRVAGGAEISAAFGPAWQLMKLDRIEPMPTDAAGAGGRVPEPQFTLITRGKSRILWGYAPGAKVIGEPTAAEKVAWLRQDWEKNDTLDGPQGQPRELNLRTLGNGKAARQIP